MMKIRELTDVSLHTIQDRRWPYVKSLEPAVCAYVWICSVYGWRAHSITPSPADVCCQGDCVHSGVLSLVFPVQLCY